MIETYTAYRAGRELVREQGDENYEPGEMVRHLLNPKALGTVIAVNDDPCLDSRVEDYVTVLWSHPPDETKGSSSVRTSIDLKAYNRMFFKWAPELVE